MSLFLELQRLYRTDRFLVEVPHTEIVAQVLRNSDALTLSWLRSLGLTLLENAKISVSTQERFEMLAGHAASSRPDITIRLRAPEANELVFVESKLPSTQGDDQLQRYADHLASQWMIEKLSRASLVFITRDYEASEKPEVQGSLFQPEFVSARWFQFYQQLKAHLNGDGLAQELKLFMEESRMSLGNQFRSTDVVALENFLSAKALMDETLDGEVTEEAQRVFDWVDSSKQFAEKQLRDHHRYIIANANWNATHCLIGYWLPHESPDGRVWVGVTVDCNPKAESGQESIGAFRRWSKDSNQSWTYEDDPTWGTMQNGKDLQCFMAEKDQVRAIKSYLIELLKEVAEFKRQFPKVLWA